MSTNLEKALQVEGFEPLPSSDGEPHTEYVRCFTPHAYGTFEITEKVPGKIVAGGYWHEILTGGGTVQQYWAIDENNQCWLNTFDENYLPIEEAALIARCMTDEVDPDEWDLSLGALRSIRETLGKKPFPPRWIRMALKAGCTFPEGFNLDQYETK